MEDKQLSIDRTRHLLYSKAAKQVIRDRLDGDYPPERVEELWEAVQLTYASFLTDLPYMGGKANGQAVGIYDSLAFFAYYEAVPDKPTLEQFQETVSARFAPAWKRASPFNFNWPWVQRIGQAIFNHLAKTAEKHRQDWPGNYIMEAQPYEPGQGARYLFHYCPIADFAKKHGYEQLMPAMCNPDYPTLEPLHCTLIRTTTCGCGDVCDYRLVGDQSPLIQTHPLYTDEAGYWRNRGDSFGDR